MTLFHLLYYIYIFTIITFCECNYVKRALKEIFFQIKCFIIKLALYDLASYADECRMCKLMIGWLLLSKQAGFQALFSMYSLSIPFIASSQLLSSPI